MPISSSEATAKSRANEDDAQKKESTTFYQWLRSRIIYVPFGRLQGDQPVSPEADGLLIGREAQRLQLITALLDNAHRGAYLITGHRGSGKTTLVRHCLKEYENSAYERYLNRNVGKAVLWDRLALLIFALALLIALMVLHNLLGLLVRKSQEGGVEPALVIIELLVVALLLVPLLNAAHILDFVVKCANFPNQRVVVSVGLLLGYVYTLNLLLFSWGHEFGVWYANALLIWVAMLPLLGQVLGGTKGRHWIFPLLAGASSGLIGMLFAMLIEDADVTIIFACQLVLAVFIGHRPHLREAAPSEEAAEKPDKLSPLVGGYMLLLLLAIYLAKEKWVYLAFAIAVLVVGFLLSLRSHVADSHDWERRTHKPLNLMLLKIAALGLLSTQLLFPVWSHFPALVDFAFHDSVIRAINPGLESTAIAEPVTPTSQSGLSPILADPNSNLKDHEVSKKSETEPKKFKAEKALEEASPDKDLRSWILINISIISLIFFLEFEWIARARAQYRKDRPLSDIESWQLGIKQLGGDVDWRGVRNFESQLFSLTFFQTVFQRWNPLLVVPVNLGFDALDHRRVIEAMLSCLREEYEKAFISWRSPIEAIKKIAVATTAVYATFSLSFHAFYVNGDSHELLSAGSYCGKVEHPVAATVASNVSAPPGMLLACGLGGETLAKFLQSSALYRAAASKDEGVPHLIHRPRGDDSRGFEVPRETTLAVLIQELGSSSPDQSEILMPRIYHIITFLGLLLAINQIMSRYWPYYKVSQRLHYLSASLSGKIRDDSVDAQSIWSRLAGVLIGRDRAKLVESDPVDPRAVEVATLSLMRKMQEFRLVLPYSANRHLSFPAPEILFKLDELDKLGVGVIPEHDSSGPEVEPTQGLDLERRRSKALHNLFAEMKNLLASGVARFIFIGGRNLHDEWLADLSARRPLLTNIFDVEIHLPSLLTDDIEGRNGPRCDMNIRWMLSHLYKQCRVNQEISEKRNDFYSHEAAEEGDRVLYTQTCRSEIDTMFEERIEALTSQNSLRFRLAWPNGDTGDGWSWDHLNDDFVDFLAYRSRGNARRLHALIESFAENTVSLKRECASAGVSINHSDNHSLVMRDFDIYRIQLVAEIYRRFRDAIGRKFDFSDDKLVVGALYVSDFLLKFHRRAFGWSNLQRVDELVHIHRAPDLPIVFSGIIDSWSERYLHTIRNGMYDYRFNSEFSRELRYLSRNSEEELAAVNFTLDESQALKAIYRARFRQLQDNQAFEFIGALGELHEFDEEYEISRFYYRKAISYLDSRLKGEIALHEEDSVLHLVLMQETVGLDVVRRRLNWALARLRLNLQVGMSYERAEDFEQAQAHYRNARTFAASVLRALLNAEKEYGVIFVPQSPDKGRPDFMSTLKHFNILFQPVFAEAWICEKLRGGVDTSMRILERSIWEQRWILPSVREEFDALNDALPAGGLRSFRRQHLNFYLTMAEQHNKVGDLLYFKACPDISPRRPGKLKRLVDFGGFLGRAHYHYAVSLQEIRSFVAFRRERNARLGIPEWEIQLSEVDPKLAWPDFVIDSLSDSLADLADTLLARVSVADLMTGQLGCEESVALGTPSEKREIFRKIFGCFKGWMERVPSGVPEYAAEKSWGKYVGKLLGAGGGKFKLHDVLGQRQVVSIDGEFIVRRPCRRGEASGLESKFAEQSEQEVVDRYRKISQGDVKPLITLDVGMGGLSVLANYFALTLIAAHVLDQGGRHEDAARKASRVVEVIVQYLLIFRLVKWLKVSQVSLGRKVWSALYADLDVSDMLVGNLIAVGVMSASLACQSFQKARFRFIDFNRGQGSEDPQMQAGRLVPTAVCVQFCGLGIHGLALLGSRFPQLEYRQVIRGVAGPFAKEDELDVARLVKVIKAVLEKNAYPIFARLHGLKMLVDNAILESAYVPSGVPKKKEKSVRVWFSELESTVESFDSPLHFTHFHLGVTRSLYAIESYLSHPGAAPQTLKSDLLEARETLRSSIEMISMQKTFYRTIDNLYYLHDDFNDRRVHLGHALQMAGSEITKLLIEQLDWILENLAEGS